MQLKDKHAEKELLTADMPMKRFEYRAIRQTAGQNVAH